MLSPDLAARFWPKVNKKSPEKCWEWTAQIGNKGYGFLFTGSRRKGTGKPELAHRVSWFLENGEIPDGKWILHRCDNRKCVNPAHLFLGDHASNMKDMVEKGRWDLSGKRRSNASVYKKRPGSAARGERAGNSIMTEESVIALRTAFSSGAGTVSELASEYGLSKTGAWHIINGESWTHLPVLPKPSRQFMIARRNEKIRLAKSKP